MSSLSLGQWVSNGLFLSFVAGIPLYGMIKRINVYETFIDGAKEGVNLIVRLIPYFVAMIVAIGMFRASGGFTLLGKWLAPALSWLGIPIEVFPLAIVRPFSGQASNAVLVNIIETHGGDSIFSKMAATMMGSTETTFYVIAIYFVAVGIARTRHAVPVGLIADFVGILSAVWICRWMFG